MTAIEASARSLPAGRAEAAPPWKIWTALWIVYIVWGSTYLAIALMVETMPPLLAAGSRFVAVGLILLPILAWRRGASVWRPSRAELLAAGFVGLMLPGANAVISVAEQTVPSSLAALLIASIPLWVILLRRATGEHVSGRSLGAVLVGFAGVALLLKPEGDATIIGLLACIGGAIMWATGSFASPRISLPRDPLVSTAWQSLLGGIVIVAVGFIAGEARRRAPRRVVRALDLRPRLPDHVRLAAGLHVLRVAAAERADLEGLHLRLRQPGRRDRARLADPERVDHAADAAGRRNHHRVGRARRPRRVPPNLKRPCTADPPQEQLKRQLREPHAGRADVRRPVEAESFGRISEPPPLGRLELFRHRPRILSEREQEQEILTLRLRVAVDHQRTGLDQNCSEQGGSTQNECVPVEAHAH